MGEPCEATVATKTKRTNDLVLQALVQSVVHELQNAKVAASCSEVK
jgi:hypothetical protein